MGRRSRAAIPVIVLGVFRYSIMNVRHRKTCETWLDGHLGQFEVLPAAEGTAFPCARLRAAMKQQGKPIPSNDAWIAAHAIQHRLPLLSRDRHVAVVPGVDRIGG